MSNIIQAAKWMGEGKKVRAADWLTCSYLTLDEIGNIINMDGVPYTCFNNYSLLRNDWEIFKEIPTEKLEASELQLRVTPDDNEASWGFVVGDEFFAFGSVPELNPILGAPEEELSSRYIAEQGRKMYMETGFRFEGYPLKDCGPDISSEAKQE